MDETLDMELEELLKELARKDHAAHAIWIAARLDYLLASHLGFYMPKLSNRLRERLFDGFGPLSVHGEPCAPSVMRRVGAVRNVKLTMRSGYNRHRSAEARSRRGQQPDNIVVPVQAFGGERVLSFSGHS